MSEQYLKNASFIKSITDLSQKPNKLLPEIAFVGRSNVGKSSLLNAITNRKKLAKISSTPGKTRLINYFLIDNLFYLVDLPGYGFAKLGKTEHKKWKTMLESFIKGSEQLCLICLLIDSRHGFLPNDLQMLEWLTHYQKPFIIILTKTDKISKNRLNYFVRKINKIYPDHHVLPFSIKSEDYRIELVNLLKNLLERT